MALSDEERDFIESLPLRERSEDKRLWWLGGTLIFVAVLAVTIALAIAP